MCVVMNVIHMLSQIIKTIYIGVEMVHPDIVNILKRIARALERIANDKERNEGGV